MYSWLDCDTEIRLKVKCVTLDPKYKLIQSEIREDRGSVSESSALELKLDIDELYTMCMRPLVETFISQLIVMKVIRKIKGRGQTSWLGEILTFLEPTQLSPKI